MTEFSGGLTAGLRVQTERGPVAIEELDVGDRVLSQAPSTGENSFKPITRTFVHRDRPIRRVSYLLDGQEIGLMATDDLCFGVAAAAGTLIEGERIGLAIDGPAPGIAALGWTRADVLARPDNRLLMKGRSALCHELLLMDGRRVVCTQNELILETDRPHVGWIASSQGSKTGTALDFSGKLTLVASRVKRPPSPVAGGDRRLLATVYNIEVADNHSFYIGEEGVLVHDGNGR